MQKEPKIIDLTHALSKDIPSWDGNTGFELTTEVDYKDGRTLKSFRAQKIKCEAGIGTHMDAPAHVIEGGRTIDQLTLPELVTDCVVIDVSREADENYIIMPSVVEKFEKEYGEIKQNTFVIFYTRWSKHWSDRKRYHNNHKFPSVDVSTAEFLLKRKIVGLGIDTLSCDTGANGFPVHQAILGADKYLVENIASVGELPALGVKSFLLPMKIKDATEAPVRLIALF